MVRLIIGGAPAGAVGRASLGLVAAWVSGSTLALLRAEARLQAAKIIGSDPTGAHLPNLECRLVAPTEITSF